MGKKLGADECFKICKDVAKKYDYDEYLLYAIVETESNRVYDAVSKSGAVGLMQITDVARLEVNQFYRDNFSQLDLFIPEKNIEIGAKLLYRWINHYLKSYPEYIAVLLSIMTYSWGYGNVQNWLVNSEGDNQKITEYIPFEKLQYNEDVLWWYVFAKKYFGGEKA